MAAQPEISLDNNLAYVANAFALYAVETPKRGPETPVHPSLYGQYASLVWSVAVLDAAELAA